MKLNRTLSKGLVDLLPNANLSDNHSLFKLNNIPLLWGGGLGDGNLTGDI